MGDAGAFLVALVIGGMATEASDLSTLAFPDLNEVVGLSAALALWWRRRAPLVVTLVTFVGAAIAPLAAGPAIVSIFTVAALRSVRTAVAVGVLYLAPGAISLAARGGTPAPGELEGAVAGGLLTAAAVGWGLAARSRRETMAALADRADRAEAEQHARIAEARATERARIATEMHDVLAHRLSMLSLHAGAIEVRVDAPREELARAAAVVRTNAHVALDELRDVIGVLREDGTPSLAPAPTATDLDGLFDEATAAGMRIAATVTAPLASLPTELGRHAFRIVQEGLTNARKHAPAAPVEVSVAGTPGGRLLVEVTNAHPVDVGTAIPGAGVGLVGLRERVALAGGELSCGAEADGTYRLRAELPWPT